MREEMRAFLTRAADYTLTPLPAMLRLATRAPGLGDPPAMRKVYRLGDGRARRDDRCAAPRAGGAGGGAGWPSRWRTGRGRRRLDPVVKGLVKQGRARRGQPARSPYPRLDPDAPGKALTDDQAAAADSAARAVRAGAMAPRC
jgi:primosomal protein N' (replication factor Y)